MRSPVKEPGPSVTAKSPISGRATRVCSSRFSTIGRMVWEWVSFTLVKNSPSSFPSSVTAQEADWEEVSIARIFKTVPPRW